MCRIKPLYSLTKVRGIGRLVPHLRGIIRLDDECNERREILIKQGFEVGDHPQALSVRRESRRKEGSDTRAVGGNGGRHQIFSVELSADKGKCLQQRLVHILCGGQRHYVPTRGATRDCAADLQQTLALRTYPAEKFCDITCARYSGIHSWVTV